MLMEVQFAAGAAGYVHNHVHEQISYCTAEHSSTRWMGDSTSSRQGDSIYVPE